MDSPNASVRPLIISTRLRIEPVEERHATAMFDLLDDPELHRYLNGGPLSLEHLQKQYALLSSGKSRDGTELWLTWIMLQRSEQANPVGYIQATIREPEQFFVAYVVGRDHWREGLAKEAVTAMIDTVFERYQVKRAIIEMDTRNLASIGLAQALEFRFVETVRDGEDPDGAEAYEHVYELKRAEWSASRSRH